MKKMTIFFFKKDFYSDDDDYELSFSCVCMCWTCHLSVFFRENLWTMRSSATNVPRFFYFSL